MRLLKRVNGTVHILIRQTFQVTVPAGNVTSLCFAGDNLADLHLTAAQGERLTEVDTLFSITTNVTGKKGYKSQIKVIKTL